MNTFSERLQFLREQKGLKKTDICKALNINKTTYYGYENGSRQPDFDLLILFADYFNVSTDYLLGKTDNIQPEPIQINKSFSERLKYLMSKHNLTAEQTAKIIDVDPLVIYNYIQNKKAIEKSIANKLTEFFDITEDYLFGYTDNPKGLSPKRDTATWEDAKTRLAQLDIFKGYDIMNMSIAEFKKVLDILNIINKKTDNE